MSSIRYIGKIDLRVRNTLRKASLLTWGRANLVRLSCYGSCNYNYNFFLDSLTKGRGHWYILLVNDCQNFARKVVKELTGKVVGIFPIEDGPKFNSDEYYQEYYHPNSGFPCIIF